MMDLYLFIPPETSLSARTLPESQFFFGSVDHRFGLMGLQGNDRAIKSDDSYALLSPYFEIANGSWLLRYKASMGRLRQQVRSRSEEHTSELQSRPHLVCRLLLEKKKKKTKKIIKQIKRKTKIKSVMICNHATT